MAEKAKPVKQKKQKEEKLPLVEVFLPKAGSKEENFVFVGLNGKGYQIRRGTPVWVPQPVFEILEKSERAKQRQEEFLLQQRQLAEKTVGSR